MSKAINSMESSGTKQCVKVSSDKATVLPTMNKWAIKLA